MSLVAWQLWLGSFQVVIVGLILGRPDVATLA